MSAGIDFWMFDRMMDMTGAKGGHDDYDSHPSHNTSDIKIENDYPYPGCNICEKVDKCEEVRIWRERHFKDYCPDGTSKE